MSGDEFYSAEEITLEISERPFEKPLSSAGGKSCIRVIFATIGTLPTADGLCFRGVTPELSSCLYYHGICLE